MSLKKRRKKFSASTVKLLTWYFCRDSVSLHLLTRLVLEMLRNNYIQQIFLGMDL